MPPQRIGWTTLKLTITFNWKDGTKTVTLAELEAASENTTGEESQNKGISSGSFFGRYQPKNKIRLITAIERIFLFNSCTEMDGRKCLYPRPNTPCLRWCS